MRSGVREVGRAKISATVDAVLLGEVDAFVASHPGLTRSEVLDEALQLWSARQREREMEEVYRQLPSAEEAAEYAAWRRIRRAAAAARLARPR